MILGPHHLRMLSGLVNVVAKLSESAERSLSQDEASLADHTAVELPPLPGARVNTTGLST